MFFAAAFNPVFEESALGLLSVHVSPLREDEDVFWAAQPLLSLLENM